jgi:F-type H+-transporting ATPase subunit beta
VPVAKTLDGFEAILDGRCDGIGEQAFYMMGSLDDVYAKHNAMQAAKVD